MNQLAPAQIAGWKASGEDRVFDRQSIFTHLNGGAEVYLHYGMVRLFTRRYTRIRRPEVSLSIFDMGHARGAFGVFSHEREGDTAGVGQDSDHQGGLLRFWKGRYFVAISSFRVTGPVRAAALALGRQVAGRIKQAGQRPPLVGRLPARGLQPGSVRYLQSDAVLGLHWPQLAGKKLGLDPAAGNSQAVVARYGSGEQRLDVLVASFSDLAAAARARDTLSGVSELAGKLSVKVCGPWLVAATGAPAGQGRVRLVELLATRTLKSEECMDDQKK